MWCDAMRCSVDTATYFPNTATRNGPRYSYVYMYMYIYIYIYIYIYMYDIQPREPSPATSYSKSDNECAWLANWLNQKESRWSTKRRGRECAQNITDIKSQKKQSNRTAGTNGISLLHNFDNLLSTKVILVTSLLPPPPHTPPDFPSFHHAEFIGDIEDRGAP